MKMDESAEEGALHELQEETGLEGAYIRQFHTFTAPQRDPRERDITIAYYALVRIQEVNGGDDAADARWFALDEVPQLAFDHDQILRKAEQALRQQIHFEPVGFELLPEEFTIKELQNLYKAILDVIRLPQLLQQDEAHRNAGTDALDSKPFSEERSLPLPLQQSEI